MPSETDIVNMALLGIGAKPKITSLSEDSDNARLARAFYQPVVDSVLRSHIWNCAIERPSSSLTALSEAPDTDYDYQFQLPASPWCLRLLKVGTDDDQPTTAPLASVIETIVLLKVALICATPKAATFLIFFFLTATLPSLVAITDYVFSSSFFLPRPTVLRLPRLVRPFVLVRCPRHGKPLRCLEPR